MDNSAEVIILAGGLGTRLQEETTLKPKPMVKIGRYPMLLHIMSIYIDQGFSNFVISAGYKAEVIREYFRDFELHSKDVEVTHNNHGAIISKYTKNKITKLKTELSVLTKPWHINIVDTGIQTTSRLIAYIDSATGLPILPNGGDISVAFSSGSSKIFAL